MHPTPFPDFSLISFLAATWGKMYLPILRADMSERARWEGRIIGRSQDMVFSSPALPGFYLIPNFLLQDGFEMFRWRAMWPQRSSK